jgi:predicted hotdog family 3-hydroxylacyl-ACP dehydratase
LNSFPAIEVLIPHHPPMRWIDALIACTETTATATARFPAGHFAVADGRLIETALVECVAQTVAAALGQRQRAQGGESGAANHGMLAAVSNFKILAVPPLDQTLIIEVRELKRLGPMLMITATVSGNGQTIATGELSLYA